MRKLFGILIMMIAGLAAPAHAVCLSEAAPKSEVCKPSEVFVYLDQKTLIAGQGSVLVVAEVTTHAGHSPRDDSLVHFFARGGETVSRRIAFTEAGVARARMPLSEFAGSVEVWAEAGGARADVQWLEIVPAQPVPFSMAVSGCGPDRSCWIEVKGLQDRFGNRLPDGLQGTLTTHVHGKLHAQQTVHTVRGTILAPWRHPDARAKLRLTLAGESADLWVAP